MAVTVTATLLGTYTSKVTAVGMSSATGSVDILTVPHQLGTTPDDVRYVVRSVVNTASVGTPGLNVLSYNGSQAVLQLNPSPVATNVIVDVICQYVHSIGR